MRHHPESEQLSEYLDGSLNALQRDRLETHLAGCPECGALVAELRRVVQRAQALDDHPPRADLWPDVAAAIGAAPPRRWRVSFSLPQLLAAGIVLALLSGGAVWLGLRPDLARNGPSRAPAGPTPDSQVRTIAAGSASQRSYAAAVQDLEQVLAEGKGSLDTATVRVVEEKLHLIDRAITEAERALANDPGNSYLHAHLAETRLRKLQLLRQAAELTRAAS